MQEQIQNYHIHQIQHQIHQKWWEKIGVMISCFISPYIATTTFHFVTSQSAANFKCKVQGKWLNKMELVISCQWNVDQGVHFTEVFWKAISSQFQFQYLRIVCVYKIKLRLVAYPLRMQPNLRMKEIFYYWFEVKE